MVKWKNGKSEKWIRQKWKKKLENFGVYLLSEDDHSYWAPPYWNITKETFFLGRAEL